MWKSAVENRARCFRISKGVGKVLKKCDGGDGSNSGGSMWLWW